MASAKTISWSIIQFNCVVLLGDMPDSSTWEEVILIRQIPNGLSSGFGIFAKPFYKLYVLLGRFLPCLRIK